MKPYDLGIKGEELAVTHLRSKGYKILERNWRFRKAEIDIIAARGNFLVVVEVKTRTTDYFGDPHEFVKKSQLRMLKGAINAYVNRYNLDVEVRFDVIGIIKSDGICRITHLEDAYFIF